jgi:hypothetical protein
MQDQEPVGPGHEDKRRRDQRVDECLRIIEAGADRIVGLDAAHERERARAADLDPLPALQEDPFRAGKLFPHADQIAALEGEIEVAGEAVGQAVVGGLVALEALRGLRKVDRDGERQEDQREGRRHDRAQVPHRAAGRRAGECGVDHPDTPEVRNERSARSTPCRRVVRDTS